MSITKKRLLAWQDAKEILDVAKEKELELRNELCSEILKDKTKGSVSVSKFGFKAKATAKMNAKLDVDDLKAIFTKLSAEEKACIKYKPELITKKYKDLPENSILHKAVSEKPGTPSFELKPLEN